MGELVTVVGVLVAMADVLVAVADVLVAVLLRVGYRFLPHIEPF